jgi:DNA mismatch repair ATPase MutS
VVAGLEYVFYRKQRAAFEKLSSSLDQFHSQLQLLVGLFRVFEKEEFTSAKGQKLKEQLKSEKGFASQQFERLDFWVGFLNHCMRNQIVILFAMLLQLNVITAYYIDRWRLENAKHILNWLKALGELEAMTSLSIYAYENETNAYPTIKARKDKIFSGKNLGHPLLPKDVCVSNDVTMNPECRLLIVSGSNMAGKSTFLRTVGVNAVLAYSGLPVRADELTISPLALGMTLTIQDSLQDGKSRFYSEIDTIRRIRNLMDGDTPVLFVLDELLSGTNSNERLIGSEALLRKFMTLKTLGMVTTHDLSLTELASSLQETKNIYLSEKWTDGKPDFDYKVNEGVQKQGNALQWMRALGLEV